MPLPPSPPTALVAGASRGLALALSAELARRGWDVVGTYLDHAGRPVPW